MDNYHYKECGLSNIYLKNGYKIVEYEKRSGVGISNMDLLHRSIGDSILNKTFLMTGEEIRFLRIELDLSQKDLAGVLGSTDQTVANFEKNKSPHSKADDIIIRMLYADSIGFKKNFSYFLAQFELDNLDYTAKYFKENVVWEQVY
jgi:putative transcriptional regulator